MLKMVLIIIASIIVFLILSLFYLNSPKEIQSPELDTVGEDEVIIESPNPSN